MGVQTLELGTGLVATPDNGMSVCTDPGAQHRDRGNPLQWTQPIHYHYRCTSIQLVFLLFFFSGIVKSIIWKRRPAYELAGGQ